MLFVCIFILILLDPSQSYTFRNHHRPKHLCAKHLALRVMSIFVRPGEIFVRPGKIFVRPVKIFVRHGKVFVRHGKIFVRPVEALRLYQISCCRFNSCHK